jgi:hypothetical protein
LERLKQLSKNKLKSRRNPPVFVGSMMDVLKNNATLDHKGNLYWGGKRILEYGTIERHFFNEIVPVHQSYVLTTHKRPSNINKYIPTGRVIHPRM